MAEANSSSDDKTVTFSVKSSSDQKYTVTVPESMTVVDLKEKLSTAEYADVSSDRQRLIYSGRVLKDPDQLSVYKIKDGNTVHMVKGAASNQRSSQASQGSSTPSGAASSSPAATGVPQNLATGTGNDPLAALTGARYAGFAQMPGASTFGPDGGMGPPPNPDDMLAMLENPMFASQMNEAMNNPDVIRMMSNNPMIQQNPMLRNALQNPEFRRMLMDPQIIRASMQMQRSMGGDGMGQGQSSMPAPGLTDTTPGGAAAATSPAAGQTGSANPTSPPAFNPFQFMGQAGQGGAGAATNPFAALFGGAPANTTNTPSNTSSQSPPPQSNPFGSLMAGMPGQTGGQQDALGSMMQHMMQNPAAMQQAQQMMQNPEAMQQAMQAMQGMGMGGFGGTGSTNSQGAASNPFSLFGNMGGAPAQQDSRPPEEQYSEQLRQLNEMGFYEFERNVRALRMSGGSVQGAVEALLGGGA